MIAVVLCVLGVKVVHPLGLILDPGLDIVELGVRHLGLLVNLLGQTLEFFESGNFFVNDVISFLVDHHQLVPTSLEAVRMEVAVDVLAGVLQEPFNLAEGVSHPLLLVQPVIS